MTIPKLILWGILSLEQTAGHPITTAQSPRTSVPRPSPFLGETMHGYGLDRQFRGEIRGLQIFGSRTGGRGARSLTQIQEALR